MIGLDLNRSEEYLRDLLHFSLLGYIGVSLSVCPGINDWQFDLMEQQ